MDPYANYYLLELQMDTTTRTKVSKWQFLRVINGTRVALTVATDLPVSINQGRWHNLKVMAVCQVLCNFDGAGQALVSTVIRRNFNPRITA